MTDLHQGASAPVVYPFDSFSVRVVLIDGDPWFVAADVCDALGIRKHRDALSKLDADERGSVKVDTLGGVQELAAVNESGLYTLILRCRGATKPGTIPHRFRKWVTGDVLPSIRKTGSYQSPLPHAPARVLDPRITEPRPGDDLRPFFLVGFLGDRIPVIDDHGEPYVPTHLIALYLDLNWDLERGWLTAICPQALKILVTPRDDGRVDRVDNCLPLRKLPRWLAAIRLSRRADQEDRARLSAYRERCDDVLWAAWSDYCRRTARVLPGPEWVAVRRDELRRLTNSLALVEMFVTRGMQDVRDIERTTDERWYERPQESG